MTRIKTILVLSVAMLFVMAGSALAFGNIDYYSEFGHLPTDSCSDWQIKDTDSSNDPFIDEDVLDLTSSSSAYMYYYATPTETELPDTVKLEAEMKVVSETSTPGNRAVGVMIVEWDDSANGKEYSAVVYIGLDRILLMNGDTVVASSTEDTEAFHIYRLEVDRVNKTVKLYYDNGSTPLLSYGSVYYYPGAPYYTRVAFGDGTNAVGGETVWKSVTCCD